MFCPRDLAEDSSPAIRDCLAQSAPLPKDQVVVLDQLAPAFALFVTNRFRDQLAPAFAGIASCWRAHEVGVGRGKKRFDFLQRVGEGLGWKHQEVLGNPTMSQSWFPPHIQAIPAPHHRKTSLFQPPGRPQGPTRPSHPLGLPIEGVLLPGTARGSQPCGLRRSVNGQDKTDTAFPNRCDSNRCHFSTGQLCSDTNSVTIRHHYTILNLITCYRFRKPIH